MNRAAVFLALPLVVIALTVCNEGRGTITCTADLDCPSGSICRDNRCGLINNDGGGPQLLPEAGIGTSCAADNLGCSNDIQCCSGNCVNALCSPITASPAPTCKNVYELCIADCCPGLTCTNGSCR